VIAITGFFDGSIVASMSKVENVTQVVEAYVGISEDDFIDVVVIQQIIEFFFGADRNTVRVQRACKRGRITTIVDVRDLRRRDSNDIDFRIIPVTAIENMEVTSRSSHDNDLSTHH
jgi:hypothetical protein